MVLCKVEYLAQKQRIGQRLQAGYPVSYIYKELCGEGAITMSSRSLYRLINADRGGKLSGLSSGERAPVPAWRKAPAIPPDDRPSSKAFNHDPSQTDDELW